MQNTLLYSNNTSKSSRQVARQNSELADTLTSPSKGIFSQQQTQSAELVENLSQKNTSRGQFSHLMNGTIEDWKTEFDRHPEWQGLSTEGVQRKIVEGGNAFCLAFLKWRKNKVKDIEDKGERIKEENRLKNIIFPDKNKDRSNFEKIEDWKAEFDKYLEWKGLSTPEIIRRKKDGGSAFYRSFNSWKKKQLEIITDEEERQKEDRRLKNILFPDKYTNRSNFEEIEDWKIEFDRHLEWQGLSIKQLEKIEGGKAFYGAFLRWRANKVKDIKDKRERIKEENRLKNIISPDKNRDWSNLETIEDWETEFDKHPEWQGLSTQEVKNRRNDGGLSFYSGFLKWRKNEVKDIKDKGERIKEENRLKNIIFPDKNKDRSNFEKIEDWKAEFDKHLEWKGLSTKEMRNSFYQAFTTWKNKQTKHIKDHTKREEENKKLTMILFPEIKTPLYYTFNHNRVSFDSAGERKCAMILHKLGLAPTFIEGENLHVRSNGKALNSLDFKIGSVFLEYHPAQRRKTFTEGSQKKYKHITNLHHKDQTELYVFDDIYELYDIVRENRTLIHHVPVEKLHYLTHPDEFKLLVTQINKELVDYDIENTELNNIQSTGYLISETNNQAA